MTALFLHVGPTKTGSTFIQQRLVKDKSALHNHRIDHPDAYWMMGSHHKLADIIEAQAFDQDFDASIYEPLENAKNKNLSTLISSERLDTVNNRKLALFLSQSPHDELVVIYSYRTPSHRLASHWQELIKHGWFTSFPEYASQHFLKPYNSRILNCAARLEFYSSLPKSRVSVLDHQSSLKHGSTYDQFLEALGVPPPRLRDHEIINESLPPAVIEILRVLNGIHRANGYEISSHVREIVYSKAARQRLAQDGVYALFDRADKTKIKIGDTLADQAIFRQIKLNQTLSFHGSLTPPWEKDLVYYPESMYLTATGRAIVKYLTEFYNDQIKDHEIFQRKRTHQKPL